MTADKQESAIRKIRVGVLFGGRSGEHEVSLMSAQSVMAALDRDRYDIVEIGITKEGHWLTGPAMDQLHAGESGAQPATLLPDPESSALLQVESSEKSPSEISEVTQLDVIIPILHGT